MTYTMVVAKRIQSLIAGFAIQSFFLFLLTFAFALTIRGTELFFVAALLLIVKVILIPRFLIWIVRRIKVNENIGLSISPLLSLAAAIALTCLAYLFATHTVRLRTAPETIPFVVSLSVMLIGLFIMIFRMKALAQIIGLLVMENGLFLAAVSLCGSMPFFVEIAIFFDLFVCVTILGVFVYRINELFTHIDVDKLTVLKG